MSFAAMNAISAQSGRLLPLWKYLNQPLFDAKTPAVLNPIRFWFLYRTHLYMDRIQWLECCWYTDVWQAHIQFNESYGYPNLLDEQIQHLERCWLLKARVR